MTIAEVDGTKVMVRTEPPTDVDEWVVIPGAKRGLRSLCIDAPSFSVVFDAASEVNDDKADMAGMYAGDEDGGACSSDHSGEGNGNAKLDLLTTKIVRQGKRS